MDFSWLTNWFNAVLQFFASLGVWILDGVKLVLEAALYYPFNGILSVIETFVSSIDLSSIAFSYSAAWAGLPPQLIYLINAVGFPTGLSMVVGALIIRMVLNLIPAAFTRI